MQARQPLEPGPAHLQEHHRVDGDEGGDRPQVQLERPALAVSGSPQHRQSLLQRVRTDVHRRHQGQVRTDPVQWSVPQGTAQALHLESDRRHQEKGHPKAVPFRLAQRRRTGR